MKNALWLMALLFAGCVSGAGASGAGASGAGASGAGVSGAGVSPATGAGEQPGGNAWPFPLAGPPVPLIDARVAAVSGERSDLVLLSVGWDDRVERGFYFSVFRGSEFVGKVVVERVFKDSCGCHTLFTKEGFSIQPGDAAATRLQ